MNASVPSRFIHYIIDIPELDAEHLELLTLLANFKASNDEVKREEIKQTFLTKWKLHREAEELCMKLINFPFIAAHIEIHKTLTTSFESQVNNRNIYSSLLVEDELLRHIDLMDSQITEYYK
jgi:hemerythrin